MKAISLLAVIIVFNFRYVSCDLNQRRFPDDFSFGVGSSAYQIEGAWNESGKGPSIWDHWTHTRQFFILDGKNADISSDSYHHLENDVKLLKDLGVNHYRFSLSWPRIFSSGLPNSINQEAITYYSNLLQALNETNIAAMVTIFHWDMPKTMHDLGGWTNKVVVNYYVQYAKAVIQQFGDKVAFWLTFHDPYATCVETNGIKGFDEYRCMHNVLKAHAQVYRYYKENTNFKGKMSISFNAEWYEAADASSSSDEYAAERTMQFTLGWLAHPLFSEEGDYPEIIKERILERSTLEGLNYSRLPEFTDEEIEYVKGSADFFAFSHFTTHYVTENQEASANEFSFANDVKVLQSEDYSAQLSASGWLWVIPEGFRDILNWIAINYGNIDIYVTGNGYADNGELDDQERVDYHLVYLSSLLDAVDDGVNIKGYTVWSFLDGFEWREGYSHRFGLFHVNFTDTRRSRTAKESTSVYKAIISNRVLNYTDNSD